MNRSEDTGKRLRIGVLAARASDALNLTPETYSRLVGECLAIAGNYEWAEIAEYTIRKSHSVLASLGKPTTSV